MNAFDRITHTASINAIAFSQRQILYTIGKPTLLLVDLPAEPLLTNWQAQYARLLAAAPAEPNA